VVLLNPFTKKEKGGEEQRTIRTRISLISNALVMTTNISVDLDHRENFKGLLGVITSKGRISVHLKRSFWVCEAIEVNEREGISRGVQAC
jgi:hypothetical protein